MNPAKIIALITVLSPATFVIAEPIALLASKDTYITDYSSSGGVTSTHGSDTGMHFRRELPNQSIPLIYFDLSPYSGRTLNGAQAKITLFSEGPTGSAGATLRKSLVDWDENSTSYANFGESGFDEISHAGASFSESIIYVYPGHPPNTLFSVDFYFSSSVIQQWIDNPTQNKGLCVLKADWDDKYFKVFGTKEGGAPAKLTFDLSPIPEPGTVSLFGVSAMGLFITRTLKRRKRLGLSILPLRKKSGCKNLDQILETTEPIQRKTQKSLKPFLCIQSNWSSITIQNIQSLLSTADKNFWNFMVKIYERRSNAKLVRKKQLSALRQKLLTYFDAFLEIIIK
jgi:hypothetical protein